MYLGTSPEFSRTCLYPLISKKAAGLGFIGTIFTVFMKFFSVWKPTGGASVLAGTGGFF